MNWFKVTTGNVDNVSRCCQRMLVIQLIATKLTAFCITKNFNVIACESCSVEVMLADEQSRVHAIDITLNLKRSIISQPWATADSTTIEAAAAQRISGLLEGFGGTGSKILSWAWKKIIVYITCWVTCVEVKLLRRPIPATPCPTYGGIQCLTN